MSVSNSKKQNRDSVQEAIDKSESGAPAGGEAVRDRFSATEIFERVVASAQEEIETGPRELFFSGVAAGFAITVTVLGYVAMSAVVGFGSPLSPLLYPLGFVFIVIGHYQLYTENTLPPVTLVLARLASLPALLRVWGVVILGNLVGVGVGGYLLANGGVFSPEAAAVATELGSHGIEMPWWEVFSRSVFAGWLVAGVVWLDHAVRNSSARFLLVYFILFAIPATGLFHVITAMCESLVVFFQGGIDLVPLVWEYITPVLCGNTLGGVVPVAVLNFAQTDPETRYPHEKLSVSEWLFGGLAGRSRVADADQEEFDSIEER